MSRPSAVVASSGLRSHPRRSATANRSGSAGRLALPHVGEAHRAVRVAGHGSPGVVAVVVPAQVEAGAGADLEHAQREPACRRATSAKPPTRTADRPTSFVCTPSPSRAAISSACCSTVARNGGPGSPRPRAARRRVVRGELGCRGPRARAGGPHRGTAAAARAAAARPRRPPSSRQADAAALARRRRPRRGSARRAATPSARSPAPGTRRRRSTRARLAAPLSHARDRSSGQPRDPAPPRRVTAWSPGPAGGYRGCTGAAVGGGLPNVRPERPCPCSSTRSPAPTTCGASR